MSLETYVRDHIVNLRQELQGWTRDTIREWLGNLLTSTTIARASESDDDPLVDNVQLWSSSDGLSASNAEGVDVAGLQAGQADGASVRRTAETARPRARRMEPTGFACVPVQGEVSKVLGIGANLLHFAVASTRYRPKGLKQTEWAIYNLRSVAEQLVVKGDKDSALTAAVGGFLHVELNKNGEIEFTSKAGAKVTMNAAGQIVLTSKAGAKVLMDQTTLATTLLEATHFGGNPNSIPPTVAAGPALNGGTAAVIGTDAASLVTMAVNAPGGPAGTLCTIAFGTPYDSPPQFSIAAAGPVLIPIAGLGAVFGQSNNFQLTIGTSLPISTGPLILSVIVKQ